MNLMVSILNINYFIGIFPCHVLLKINQANMKKKQ